MKLYSENDSYKLYQGNMLDMLDVIEKESIDAVLTDPPYELNFMSKGWDNAGISFQKETWQKCYEVLKPGGYLLAFGGSRTFHRIACAIEDAGFEIRDTIMWLYGSGFPKSMDISKQIDKNDKNNAKKDFVNYMNSIEITQKEIDERLKQKKLISDNSSYSVHFFNKKQPALPTQEIWNEIKVILHEKNIQEPEWINYFIDLRENGSQVYRSRQVIGTKKSGGASAWINGMNNKENEEQKYTGFSEWKITAPSTDLAKQWQGWGTALKPSFEPIIVARKPFKGSLVDNVLKYGVGGINIDECRVGNEKLVNKGMSSLGVMHDDNWVSNKEVISEVNGRFPANTILTYDETDFDEVCGGFPNTKNGNLNIGHKRGNGRNDFETFGGGTIKKNYGGDSGSASRYFYCAKASKRDRDEGLDEFETKSHAEINNRKEGSAGATRQYGGGTNPFLSVSCPRKNTHPTVKPTSLMQYLVRLVTPNNGIVLDPFNGSGSTGKAVMYENKERNKNYKYIGIELTEEYLPIAKARIEYVCNLKEDKLKDMQMTIFDLLESKGE